MNLLTFVSGAVTGAVVTLVLLAIDAHRTAEWNRKRQEMPPWP